MQLDLQGEPSIGWDQRVRLSQFSSSESTCRSKTPAACCLYCTDVAPVDVSLNHHLNPLTKAVTGTNPASARIRADHTGMTTACRQQQQQTAYVRVQRQPLNRARTRSQANRTDGQGTPTASAAAAPNPHLLLAEDEEREELVDVSCRAAGSSKAGNSRSVRSLVPQRGQPGPGQLRAPADFSGAFTFPFCFSVIIGRLLTSPTLNCVFKRSSMSRLNKPTCPIF